MSDKTITRIAAVPHPATLEDAAGRRFWSTPDGSSPGYL